MCFLSQVGYFWPSKQSVFSPLLPPLHKIFSIFLRLTSPRGSVRMPGLRDYRADLLQRRTLRPSGGDRTASRVNPRELQLRLPQNTLLYTEQSRRANILKSLRQLGAASVADTSNGSKVLASRERETIFCFLG